MTRVAPLLLTATKIPLPEVTDFQTFAAVATAAVLAVQVMPSADATALLAVPVLLTAT